jgi:GntR family transcriptional regulator
MNPHPIVQRLVTRLEEDAARPVACLIIDDIWLAVVDGSLEVGQRLPTARELAVALRVSPRAVQRAYEELERRGVTATRPGEGTYVNLANPSEAELARHRALADLCLETVQRARALGFEVEEVLDSMAEYRGLADSSLLRSRDR